MTKYLKQIIVLMVMVGATMQLAANFPEESCILNKNYDLTMLNGRGVWKFVTTNKKGRLAMKFEEGKGVVISDDSQRGIAKKYGLFLRVKKLREGFEENLSEGNYTVYLKLSTYEHAHMKIKSGWIGAFYGNIYHEKITGSKNEKEVDFWNKTIIVKSDFTFKKQIYNNQYVGVSFELFNDFKSVTIEKIAFVKKGCTGNKKPHAIVSDPKVRINEGESVWLDASKSYDEDGKIVSYLWSEKGGRTICRKSKCKVWPKKTTTYRVQVKDDKGAKAVAFKKVIVEKNQPLKIDLKLKPHKLVIDQSQKKKVPYLNISAKISGEYDQCTVSINGKKLPKKVYQKICASNGIWRRVNISKYYKQGKNNVTLQVLSMQGKLYESVKGFSVVVKKKEESRQLQLIRESVEDGTVFKLGRVKPIKKVWVLRGKNLSPKTLILKKEEGTDCNLELMQTGSVDKVEVQGSKKFSFVQLYRAPTKEGHYECHYAIYDEAGNMYQVGSSDEIWTKFDMKAKPLSVNSEITSAVTPEMDAIAMVRVLSGVAPYRLKIEWGDGNDDEKVLQSNSGTLKHKYSEPGIYHVSLSLKDDAGRGYHRDYRVKVTQKPQVKTRWQGALDVVKKSGKVITMRKKIHLSTEQVGSREVSVFSIDYSKKPSDRLYYKAFKLEVPSGVVSAEHKFRISFFTRFDLSRSFPKYDREFWFRTDEMKIGVVAESGDKGVLIRRDLNTDEEKREVVDAFGDGKTLKTTGGYSAYGVEFDGAQLTVYRYPFADGKFLNDPELIWQNDVVEGSYLNQLAVNFRGEGKLLLGHLEYDRNGDGDYDDTNESLWLNTHGIVVDWSQFEGGNSDRGDSNLSHGLVAYYPFEGNAEDASGYGNNGSEAGAVNYEDGVVGKSISFGGYDNPGSVTIPNSKNLIFHNVFAFNYWFYIKDYYGMNGNGNRSATGGQVILAKSGDRSGISIYVSQSDQKKEYFGIGVKNGYCCSTYTHVMHAYEDINDSDISLKQWHMGTFQSDGTTVSLYVDGRLMSTMPLDEFKINSEMDNQPLRIGIGQDGVWYPFNGKVDEVRVYNRVLNAKEIEDLFKMGDHNRSGKHLTLKTKPEKNHKLTFTYDYDGKNCSINFHDGSSEIQLDSCNGSITHTFDRENVYFVELKSEGLRVDSLGVPIENEGNRWIGFVSSLDYYTEPNEKYSDIVADGRIYISPSLSDKSYYWTNYRFVKPTLFNKVNGDNFTLEARMKAPSREGGISCYDPRLAVYGDSGKQAEVTFMSPGCTYYSSIGAADWYQSGGSWNCDSENSTCEDVDLSALGKDFSDWRVIKIHAKDKNLTVYYDGEMIYSMTYKGEIGKINGIYSRFKGSGSIDWVRLYDGDNNLVYSEDFNENN